MSALPAPIVAAGRGLLLAAGLGWALCAAAQPADTERGRRLFNGELPLIGKVSGHTTALPLQASRCVNCHAAGTALPSAGSTASTAPTGAAASTAPAASASTQSFGPALTPKLLLQDTRRRGGPASRYDEAALCKLLATGIDPAYIIIPASMPRYELSAADCKALWVYLTQPGR